MTVLSARIESTVASRRELVQALLVWVMSVRRAAGVVSAHLSEDLESPGVYSLTSTWQDRRDLEAHIVGAHFGILLGALELLGLRTALSLTRSLGDEDDPLALVRRLRGRAPILGQPLARAAGAETPGLGEEP